MKKVIILVAAICFLFFKSFVFAEELGKFFYTQDEKSTIYIMDAKDNSNLFPVEVLITNTWGEVKNTESMSLAAFDEKGLNYPLKYVKVLSEEKTIGYFLLKSSSDSGAS